MREIGRALINIPRSPSSKELQIKGNNCQDEHWQNVTFVDLRDRRFCLLIVELIPCPFINSTVQLGAQWNADFITSFSNKWLFLNGYGTLEPILVDTVKRHSRPRLNLTSKRLSRNISARHLHLKQPPLPPLPPPSYYSRRSQRAN